MATVFHASIEGAAGVEFRQDEDVDGNLAATRPADQQVQMIQSH